MSANKELMSKIETVLKEQVAEAEKVDKILEESRLKTMQRKRKIKEAKIEQKRVMAMIAENARKTAEAAVHEEEFKRVADEKVEITAKTFQGEERRDKWWKRTAVFFVIAVVVVCVVITDLLIMIACLAFIVIVTLVLVYRAYQFTVIHPAPVHEEELEMEIERRCDVLKKKAVSNLREKERKFEEQQARDEEERKARKAKKKAQLRFEAQLMAQHRQQQLAAAQEIIARRTASASGTGTASASSSRPASQNSLAGHAPGQTQSQDFARAGYLTNQSSMRDFQQVPMPTIEDYDGDFDPDEERHTFTGEESDYLDSSEEEVERSRQHDALFSRGEELPQSDGELFGDAVPEFLDSGDEEAPRPVRTSPRSSPRGSYRTASSSKYAPGTGPGSNKSKSSKGARAVGMEMESGSGLGARQRGAYMSAPVAVAEPVGLEMSLEDMENGIML